MNLILKNYKLKLAMAAALLFTVMAIPAFAQSNSQLACEGAGGTWDTATSKCSFGASTGLFEAGGLFESIINILTFIIGSIAVIVIIVSGVRFVVSGGDPQAVSGARNSIIYAVVGLVVAVSARLIIGFVLGAL